MAQKAVGISVRGFQQKASGKMRYDLLIGASNVVQTQAQAPGARVLNLWAATTWESNNPFMEITYPHDI